MNPLLILINLIATAAIDFSISPDKDKQNINIIRFMIHGGVDSNHKSTLEVVSMCCNSLANTTSIKIINFHNLETNTEYMRFIPRNYFMNSYFYWIELNDGLKSNTIEYSTNRAQCK
ncbi:hypothetical protein ECANGB1_2709 [Enterospora canceri]|uniref:Uncharacterized protein n=1 Tax=Enterospora canceri TaxID=1081671 RepID=A0A1Y1S604_9MICR|nr:hypothetical protein ECANGB1_2709 [Enterospora canceri]